MTISITTLVAHYPAQLAAAAAGAALVTEVFYFGPVRRLARRQRRHGAG